MRSGGVSFLVIAVVAALAGAAATAACTGGNPEFDPEPDAGSAGDGTASDGTSTTDGVVPDDGAPASFDPKCPGVRLPCGAPPEYGAPVFHLDACTLGKKEGRVET